MSKFPRISFYAWMIFPAGALGFLVWVNCMRLQRIEYVSGIAEWSVNEPAIDAASATGYAGERRRLILPGHNSGSYQWIVQTQQMLVSGNWRLRHVEYDNAPFGRETHAPSPYRWWLGLVAWCDHLLTGRSLALAVEHGALYANPLLHGLLLVGATIFTARRFGFFPAALLAGGCAFLFPFSAGFLPGAPDQPSMALVCAVGSVLPLLAGIGTGTNGRAGRCFFVAGVAGGFGLWISLADQAPLLVGIALGALPAAWVVRGNATVSFAPWRAWAAGGALMSLVAYMIEYFPANMTLQLEVNHPLYAIAWLGGGELLARVTAWIQRGFLGWKLRDGVISVFALAAVCSVPAAMALIGSRGFLAPALLSSTLTNLNGVTANNIADWVARDGITAVVMATCLPLLLLIGTAAVLLLRRQTIMTRRVLIAVALGPVLVSLGFACFQLRWFNLLDAGLLVLLVAATAGVGGMVITGLRRWLWAGLTAVLLAISAMQLLPPIGAGAQHALNEVDVEGIIERDLAHWLAHRVGPPGAIVLASPNLTTALNFHGGLRGLGTLDWENKGGLAAAVRIASATSQEEARALISQRGVTHIVIPSWDNFLDEYARLGSNLPERTFIAGLNRWTTFGWLRPVPYHLPKIGGFEGQSVVVFEVIEEQAEASALSLQTEYFVEMGQTEMAENMRPKLRRFPTNLPAMVALAQLEVARGDATALAAVFGPLLSSLSAGADRGLAWDRRVSLAYVLAQGNRPELAREQVRRCLGELNEMRLRSLSTGSLFRLQVLGKKFGLEISNPQLRTLALDLLPPASRSRL